jgi:cytochrome b561
MTQIKANCAYTGGGWQIFTGLRIDSRVWSWDHILPSLPASSSRFPGLYITIEVFMNLSSTSTRYTTASIALHWLMLLLIVAVYACIELREFYPKGSDMRNALKSWHFTLGLTVFTLVWLRIVLRLVQRTPDIQPPLPDWQRILSLLTHGALYLFMIGMPLLGWLVLSGEAKAVPFYGIDLPALIGKNKQLAETIEDIHVTIGDIGYFVIGLHAAAALYHHYLRGDNTLRRMLPWG